MAKKNWVSIRWVVGFAALAALAGCNFDDSWSSSVNEPASQNPGSNPPTGNNPTNPHSNPNNPGPGNGLPQSGTGNATLAWMPPLENTDGSTLEDLTGYRIHYGMQPGNYEFTITIHNAGLTSYVVEDLAHGTYYFAVSAVSAGGVESDLSEEASKTI